MTTGDIITLQLPPGTEGYIGVRKKRVDKPMFCMVGIETSNKKYISGVPLIELLLEFGKEQQWLFKLLLQHKNPESNLSDISSIELSPTDSAKLYRTYKTLKDMDLVRRHSKGTYMINPKALIPVDYPTAQQIWDSLK